MRLATRTISGERVGRCEIHDGISPEVIPGSRLPRSNRLLVSLLKVTLVGEMSEPAVFERLRSRRSLLGLGTKELAHKVRWISV